MKWLKVILPLMALVLFSLVFWYAVVPGIVIGFILRGRWPVLVSLIGGACLGAISRFQAGGWVLSVEYMNFTGGTAETLGFLGGWLWNGLLFYAGYRVRSCFFEGYRSANQVEKAES